MTAGGGEARPHSGAVARAAAIFENVRSGLVILVRRPYPRSSNFVPVWRYYRVRGVLAIAAVALSMLFLDAPAHEWALRLPAGLIDVAYKITDFGLSGWILAPSGVVIVLIAVLASPALDAMSRAVLAMTVTRLGYIFLAVGLPGLVGTVLKRLIGRVRPSVRGPFAYEPLSWRPDFASFPSGHAMTAFAALVAVGAVWPRARTALWTYALLIAVSRVIVSAHYPSDVMAGAAFGAFGALLVREWFAVRRLGFHVGSDGRDHGKVGPSRRRVKRVACVLLAPYTTAMCHAVGALHLRSSR